MRKESWWEGLLPAPDLWPLVQISSAPGVGRLGGKVREGRRGPLPYLYPTSHPESQRVIQSNASNLASADLSSPTEQDKALLYIG